MRIDNGEWTGRYYQRWAGASGPLQIEYVADASFDRNGNLWYAHSNIGFCCITADVLAKGSCENGDVTMVLPNGTISLINSSRVYACKNSNYVVAVRCYWEPKMIIVDTKGTATLSDDEIAQVEVIYDQDNNAVEGIWSTFTDDKEGNLWGGGSSIVMNFGKPNVAELGSSAKFNRIKIPRNDGTNLADYLADGAQVHGMDFDAAGQMWLATTSGAILVSAAKDKILAQYTADNSQLPFTQVQAVKCDPHSNSVWFGLQNGLMEFSSSTAPGADDYSDVYAYPNPVRPGYTGWITVKGLMDDSLVKIADAAGNVVAQGRSNGGMYAWDGCNISGERVASGVYYVFASQNASGSASGAVAKILVVN